MAELPTEAGAIIEAVERLAKAQEFELERGDENKAIAVAVPKGFELKSVKGLLDEYRLLPDRKKGVATITQLDAFIEYVLRHKTEQSIVFLDDTNPNAISLRAVFNPHGAAGEVTGFGDFGCAYPFPLSDEWKTWSDIEEDMPQAAFAAFLEEHIVDVLDPSAAGDKAKTLAETLGIKLAGVSTLMELSRGLSLNIGLRSEIRLDRTTGERRIVFHEEQKDDNGHPMKVPGGFVIAIPVFRLGSLYQLSVRLRYHLDDKKLPLWNLSLQGAERVLEHAIKEAGDLVHKQTALPVFRGAPAR